MKKILVMLFLCGVILCGAAACGKMSAPVPYEGSGYPHSYPRY